MAMGAASRKGVVALVSLLLFVMFIVGSARVQIDEREQLRYPVRFNLCCCFQFYTIQG